MEELSDDTYRARVRRVSGRLKDRGLEAGLLFDPEDIYWLTGYQTIGYFTFQALAVFASGKVCLVSRRVNQGLANANRVIDRFVAIEDTDDPVDVLSAFLAAQTGETAGLGMQRDAWYLTVEQHCRLEAGLRSKSMVSWNDGVKPERVIKTHAELERIRAAAQAALAALNGAYEAIEPGCSENDIAAAMHAAGIRAGSEYLGHAPLVVAGERTALCFATWRRHEVRKGDVVLLEAAGCIDRYHAMVARSVVVGTPSTVHQRAADTLLAVLETAVETIRPGVQAGEVDRAARAKAEDAGLGDYFGHRLGYGIGIGFPPNWAEGHIYALRPGSEEVLKPGMTFHIVPTFFTPEFGMCFSESVVVTESGCEVLTPCARRLWTKSG